MGGGQALAVEAVVQNGSHRACYVHTVLCHIIRANGIADKRLGQGRAVGGVFRPGQNGAVRRPHHPRRRGPKEIKGIPSPQQRRKNLNYFLLIKK